MAKVLRVNYVAMRKNSHNPGATMSNLSVQRPMLDEEVGMLMVHNVGEREVQQALRRGADQRAVLLSVLGANEGMLKEALERSGLIGGEVQADLTTSYERLKGYLPPLLVQEASRVAEVSRAEVLVELLGQLRYVADFVSSEEAPVDANVAAVERLIRNGRVDLFLP